MIARGLPALLLGMALGATGAARADDVDFRPLAVADVPRAGGAVVAPIYNGQATRGFPAVVEVFVLNTDGSAGLCSGSLIAPAIVLTAGHCLSLGLKSAGIVVFPDGVTEVDRPAFAFAVNPDFDIARIAVADVGMLVVDPP